jgi:hypothetical protein
MKEEIQKAMKPLIGMPFWSVGRIADLEWFCFGKNRREVVSRTGQTKVVSDYALHLTCGWIIVKDKQVYAANDDRYFAKGDDPFLNCGSFDWNTPEGNRLDERIAVLDKQISEKPLIVLSIDVDEIGGMSISFTDNYSLRVFPNTSFAEYWRLFEPYKETEHFVVTAEGVEQE